MRSGYRMSNRCAAIEQHKFERVFSNGKTESYFI